MAIQPGSPDTYQADRIAAMQQQIQGLPTKKDQQEIVTQQKSIAASLEHLLTILEAGNADDKVVKQLEKYRAEYVDKATLSIDAVRELQDYMKVANELQLKNGEQIQNTLSQYVSDSKDESIALKFKLLRENNVPLDERMVDIEKDLKQLLENVLYTTQDEDEKRKQEKEHKANTEKFFGFADKVLFYLDNLWNRFKPSWEDFFKGLWMLWAPQILTAFRWGVEHLNEIGHLKLLVDLAKFAGKTNKSIVGIAGKVASIPGKIVEIAGKVVTIPGKIVESLKGSAVIKKISELPDIVKNLNVTKKLSGLGNNILAYIKDTPQFKNFEMSIEWAKTMYNEIAGKVGGTISKVSTKASQLSSKVIGRVQKAVQPIIEFGTTVKGKLDRLRVDANLLGKELRDVFGEVVKGGEKLASKIRNNWLVKDGRKVTQWFGEVGKALKSDLSPIISKVAGIFKKDLSPIISKVAKVAKDLAGKIKPVISNATKLTKGFKLVGKALGPLIVVIDAVIGAMRTNGNWFDKLRGAIANVVAGFISLGQIIMDGAAWLTKMIFGEDSKIAKWFDEHKISDIQVYLIAGSAVGLDATIREDGKIGYQTQKDAGKSKGGFWENTKAYFNNMRTSQQENMDYNEDGTRLNRGDSVASAAGESERGGVDPRTNFGLKLAAYARKFAFPSSHGKCGKFVGDAVQRTLGSKVANALRGDGGKWGDKLAHTAVGKKYWEFAGSMHGSQMKNLPAGSIVSWPAIGKHKYGHVEIADGKGNLISDFYRPAKRIYRDFPNHRGNVFVPKNSATFHSTPNAVGSFDDVQDAEMDSSSILDVQSDTENPMADAEQEEQYTMANAIQDIIAASIGLENSSAESEAIYGSSRKSSSPFSKSTNMQTDSGSERVASSKPVPVTINEPVVYDRPQIDDITLIQQQMALPVT